MRNILLTTSALAVMALSATAQADVPKITVGGVIDFQLGIISDDADANQRSHNFRNDTELNFNIDGKASNGLGYGAVIILEADVTADADAQGGNAALTYVYLDGNWGRAEFGSNIAPSGTMKVGAENIARATGGIDGAWTYFANNRGGNNFLATPDLALAYGAHTGGYGAENTDNTLKVNYYTPRWSGLQVGVGYAPNDADRGQTFNRADNRTAAFGATGASGTVARAENIFYGGINYQRDVQNVGVELAATAEKGSSESNLYEDLLAWNAGAKLGYMGFSVAGSYGEWGDSLSLKTDNVGSTEYFTLGAAYETGPFGVSVTYFDSTYDVGSTAASDNEFETLSVGADYQLAPGLTPYAEVTFYEADEAGTANDNDGHVFILGTALNF